MICKISSHTEWYTTQIEQIYKWRPISAKVEQPHSSNSCLLQQKHQT